MKKQLILCVDDERVVLNSLKEQLRQHFPSNYVIEMAESGDEALTILDEYSETEYELLLIISDYIMPEMNGDELLKEIHHLFPKSVKILLTGQATLEGISKVINQTNLFRFIQKPWMEEDLMLSVNEGLKSYEQLQLIETQHQELFEKNLMLHHWVQSMVESFGLLLDTRDTTTAGHSNRMAHYAVQLADLISAQTEGPYKDVHFSTEELETLYYAALLHDVGKFGVKESILLKEFRLPPERLTLIDYRLKEMHCLIAQNKSTKDWVIADMAFIEPHVDHKSRLVVINQADFLTQDDLNYLKQLKSIHYRGLEGQLKPLITDEEYEALSVANGNLTPAERDIIRSHAALTYDILRRIPWPDHLKRVPDIAASHHERLDGSGYYLGLTGDENSIMTRILAILDVFEALTSTDRPYRKARTVAQAFEVLKVEAHQGRMDLHLIEIFEAHYDQWKMGDDDDAEDTSA